MVDDANNERLPNEAFHCKPCAFICIPEQAIAQHLLSSSHRKQILHEHLMRAQREMFSNSGVRAQMPMTANKRSQQQFYCKFCNILCQGKTQFNEHTLGSRHKQRVLDLQTSCDFCLVCNVETHGMMEFHVKTQEHLQKIGGKKLPHPGKEEKIGGDLTSLLARFHPPRIPPYFKK